MFSLNFHCIECEALVRAWLEARDADAEEMRQRLLDAARSSGRTLEEMRDAWLMSIARVADDEVPSVMRAHSPRATEAQRRSRDHELATGHSFDALASAVLLGYRPRP